MTTKKKRAMDEIPACMREALAMHEVLRRLGFFAANIYIARYKSQVAIELHAQGKTFVITCGASPEGMSEAGFKDAWTRATRLWNGDDPGMLQDDRAKIYFGSEIVKRFGMHNIIVAILAKGFVLPVFQDGVYSLLEGFPVTSGGGDA